MLVSQTLDSRASVFAEVKRTALRKDSASPLRTSMFRQTERENRKYGMLFAAFWGQV